MFILHENVDVCSIEQKEDIDMEMELSCIYEMCDSIKIYSGGKSKVVEKDSEDYAKISALLKKAFKMSRRMPALGVAIHDLTMEYKGVAIEFVFNKRQELAEMPFEKLFVRIDKNYYGINLERFLDGKYQGRCFYLNLENNLNDLMEFIECKF